MRCLVVALLIVAGCEYKSDYKYQFSTSEVVLADSSRSAALLLSQDAFIAQLTSSRAYRDSRGTCKEIEQYKNWIGTTARDWDSSEIAKVRRCLLLADSAAGKYLRYLPHHVQLVITTGDDQFDEPYTRQ